MGIFEAPDGTRLTYHRIGEGRPLICLPGGPMQAAAYLGDLGGLSALRQLVLLDPRGTGDSAVPADPATYRVDRQVADVEALRDHLGLETFDLLGHSAGGSLALLYTAAHPERLASLSLVNPSPRAAGLDITDADRREVAEKRRDEPWFPESFAALNRLWSGTSDVADRDKLTPFFYGRWGDETRAADAFGASVRNPAAAAAFYGPDALDPTATRKAVAQMTAPALVVTGEYDLQLPPRHAADFAALFPAGEVAVLPGAGHFTWLDDPAWLAQKLRAFLP